MTEIEVEHHPPRIEGEDELYTVTGKNGGWDQKWRVWFRPVTEQVVEVVDEKHGGSYSRHEYIPKAAEVLVCNEDPMLVRYNGDVIAKLVVNDIE